MLVEFEAVEAVGERRTRIEWKAHVREFVGLAKKNEQCKMIY